MRLGVDRVLWCLERNFDEGSLVALVLEAAKLRIWIELFTSKLWAKEKQWTLDVALGMSHLLRHFRDEAAFDDNVEVRGKQTMIDNTCFKKVRTVCQPHKDPREAERFKRDQKKLANFSTVPEFQAGLRASMSDLQELHQKQGDLTQAEHQRKLAIATGVIFTHAIADRSGDWGLMEREDVTSRIDKRDPITNAPLPPDNFIACDKHQNRRRGKFLIAKHLPPPIVEVMRIVLERTSADRKPCQHCLELRCQSKRRPRSI